MKSLDQPLRLRARRLLLVDRDKAERNEPLNNAPGFLPRLGETQREQHLGCAPDPRWEQSEDR